MASQKFLAKEGMNHVYYDHEFTGIRNSIGG